MRLGQRLADAARPGDTVARLGGDEFGVILQARGQRGRGYGRAAPAARRAEPTASTSPASRSHPRRASGSRCVPTTVPMPRRCSSTRTSRCTSPRSATPSSCATTPRRTTTTRTGWPWSPSCAARSATTSSSCTTSRRRRSADDASPLAVEALIRWNHPRHGLIYPDAFLPVAEQTGLIDALTDWVIGDGAAQVVAWTTSGIRPVRRGERLGAQPVARGRSPTRVQAALARTHVPRWGR